MPLSDDERAFLFQIAVMFAAAGIVAVGLSPFAWPDGFYIGVLLIVCAGVAEWASGWYLPSERE